MFIAFSPKKKLSKPDSNFYEIFVFKGFIIIAVTSKEIMSQDIHFKSNALYSCQPLFSSTNRPLRYQQPQIPKYDFCQQRAYIFSFFFQSETIRSGVPNPSSGLRHSKWHASSQNRCMRQWKMTIIWICAEVWRIVLRGVREYASHFVYIVFKSRKILSVCYVLL